MYEGNGYWAAWNPGVNGNTTDEYVLAWRHIVDIARGEGATNIRWVWAPNVVDPGNKRLSSYASIFPGDDYIDWAGLDAFNWGTTRLESRWRDSTTAFRNSIDELRKLTAKPVLIAEIASTELGGDKAAWIRDRFAEFLTDLPEVQAVVWYDGIDARFDIDWAVDTSPASLEAFRAVAMSDAYSGTLP
jgi:beta-mannanase